MNDQYNAFMKDHLDIRPIGNGILNGLSFAVKDVFDLKNVLTSAGNPDWLHTHDRATKFAPVIEQLLKKGATLRGTTHTDELMYSLNGENYHYGTPINPYAKDRIPGGSSSGSAVAVAGELVDFALGTDTGGSVRIPSAYCGIYGFRPTHGVVNMEGVIPLAKSFDTVGWMARDPKLLQQVGECLIPIQNPNDEGFCHLYFEEEAWSYLDADTYKVLQNAAKSFMEPTLTKETIRLTEEGLSEWAQLFRTIQGIEIWEEHREWITTVDPTFGPGISERFHWASTLDKKENPILMKERDVLRRQLSTLLGVNGLLVIPTAPGEAPFRELPEENLEQYRTKTMQLTCIAGLAGFPQVTIPLKNQNGLPVGLSFIANEKQDLRLLKWIANMVNK